MNNTDKSGYIFDNVRLTESGDSVIIIDQTKLPNEEVYLELKSIDDFYHAGQRCSRYRHMCRICLGC